MAANARFVEWFHPEAEMIEIACFHSWCGATGSAEHSVDRNQINDRSARAQLDQANVVLTSVHCAAKNVAIKAKHGLEVDDAKHKMVDFANMDHGSLRARGQPIA